MHASSAAARPCTVLQRGGGKYTAQGKCRMSRKLLPGTDGSATAVPRMCINVGRTSAAIGLVLCLELSCVHSLMQVRAEVQCSQCLQNRLTVPSSRQRCLQPKYGRRNLYQSRRQRCIDDLMDTGTPCGIVGHRSARMFVTADTISGLTTIPQQDEDSQAGAGVPGVRLTDWLDEELEVLQGVLKEGNRAATSASAQYLQWLSSRSARGGTSRPPVWRGPGKEPNRDSAPYRFQRMVQDMWRRMSQGGVLSYMGEEDQAKVKRALVVLAAHCALREHPFNQSIRSPKDVFSQADVNNDGEVTFEEFVEWWNTSANPPAQPAPPRQPPRIPPLKEGYHIYMWEGTKKPRRRRRRKWDAPAPLLQAGGRGAVYGGDGRGRRQRPAEGDDIPLTTVDLRGVPVEEDQREGWLAQPAPQPAAGSVTGPVTQVPSPVSLDMSRSLEVVSILVGMKADAETLVASLASDMMHAPLGAYDLEVIEDQFGGIVRRIVEDRMMLERLSEPTTGESYMAMQQGYGVRPILDLDDDNAKLLQKFMMRSSNDIRAVVVHMAGLLHKLRNAKQDGTPRYLQAWHAAEALQLYVPVSNALGLGPGFRELEELSYKAIFPDTYRNMRTWHQEIWHTSHATLVSAKAQLLEALEKREELVGVVAGYDIQGRTKALVSTFRKVFRQKKRKEDVHDMAGLRIMVDPVQDDPQPRRQIAGDVDVPDAEFNPETEAGACNDPFWEDDNPDDPSQATAISGPPGSLTSTFRDALLADAAAARAARSKSVRASTPASAPESLILGPVHVGQRRAVDAGIAAADALSAAPGGGIIAKDAGAGADGGNAAGAPTPTAALPASPAERRAAATAAAVAAAAAGAAAAAAAAAAEAAALASERTYPPPYRDRDSVLLHQIYEVVTSLWPEVPGRYKNYVDFPKINGYRSLHTCVQHPCGLQIEVQIRTQHMHQEAEEGIAAHSLYKGGLGNPEDIIDFHSRVGNQMQLLKPISSPEVALQGPPPENPPKNPVAEEVRRLEEADMRGSPGTPAPPAAPPMSAAE